MEKMTFKEKLGNFKTVTFKQWGIASACYISFTAEAILKMFVGFATFLYLMEKGIMTNANAPIYFALFVYWAVFPTWAADSYAKKHLPEWLYPRKKEN